MCEKSGLGAMAAVLLYNLLILFSIWELTYLYYVFYLLASLAFNLLYSGFLYPLLFVNARYWYFGHVQSLTIALYPFISAFILLFTREFLQIRSRLILGILVALSALVGANTLLYFAGLTSVSFANNTLMPLVIIYSVCLLAASLYYFSRGYGPALYYTIAWTFSLGGMCITGLSLANILPLSGFTFNGMLIGTALESVLMSLAIGYKVNEARGQREKARNELIEQQKLSIETKARMADSFSRFVPKEFLHFLRRESIVDVQLGDQVQQSMAILFSDIRSFTSLSEKMSPQENFDFINAYFKRVGPLVRRNGGFIDKYIGDAIMALFPGAVERAVSAAVSIQQEIEFYNERRISKDYAAISAGIGIHAGPMILGTVGEADRMDSTVISDVVNLASRLEGLTKLYGAKILISKDVFLLLQRSVQEASRCVDIVKVKGKAESITVYEVLGPTRSATHTIMCSANDGFDDAVGLYRGRRFKESLEAFERISARYPFDRAVRLYVGRCKSFIESGVPDDWDGVTTLDSK